MVQVIFISGKAQSGKSSAFTFLQNTELNGIELSFATPLKNFLKNVFGLTHEQLWGTNEQKNTLTNIPWIRLPFGTNELSELYEKFKGKNIDYDKDNMWDDYLTSRELMQIFGTQICRSMLNDCWCHGMMSQINEAVQAGWQRIYITDARFKNELTFFQHLHIDYPTFASPIVIRLQRNPLNSKHESETDLDNFNFNIFEKFKLIDNTNMTLDEKNNQVFAAIKVLI